MGEEAKKSKTNEKLRRQRELRCWTLQEAADQLYDLCFRDDENASMISADQVGRWERGVKPHSKYQAKLCTLYDKGPEELGFTDTIPQPTADDEPSQKQTIRIVIPQGLIHSSPEPIHITVSSSLTTDTHTSKSAEMLFLSHKDSDQKDNTKILYSDREVASGTNEGNSSIARLAPEQVASLLRLLALGDITMAQFDPQRRKALLQILTSVSMLTVIPQALSDPELWERVNASVDKASNVDAATLEHFETLVSTCWDLSNAGQLQVAEQVLPSFMPHLLQVAPHDAKASSLVAQGLRLQSILVAHQLKLADKVTLCQQAVVYARQSNDHTILAAALIELIAAFRYTRQYNDALRASQELLHYSQDLSPLLQSRAYIIAAETFSRCGRMREAGFYIQLAYETFPDHAERDPVVHANPNMFTMALYEGLAYLNQGDGNKALTTFEGKLFGGRLPAYHSVSVLPERIRLEITNYQGHAAILANNLEEYARCLEEGITGAISLKSQKRLDETLTTFRQDLPPSWRNEQLIKDLAERFRLVA